MLPNARAKPYRQFSYRTDTTIPNSHLTGKWYELSMGVHLRKPMMRFRVRVQCRSSLCSRGERLLIVTSTPDLLYVQLVGREIQGPNHSISKRISTIYIHLKVYRRCRCYANFCRQPSLSDWPPQNGMLGPFDVWWNGGKDSFHGNKRDWPVLSHRRHLNLVLFILFSQITGDRQLQKDQIKFARVVNTLSPDSVTFSPWVFEFS